MHFATIADEVLGTRPHFRRQSLKPSPRLGRLRDPGEFVRVSGGPLYRRVSGIRRGCGLGIDASAKSRMTSVHANQSELSRGHPSRATIFKHPNPSVGVPKQIYEARPVFLIGATAPGAFPPLPGLLELGASHRRRRTRKLPHGDGREDQPPQPHDHRVSPLGDVVGWRVTLRRMLAGCVIAVVGYTLAT
jgi:hypothetical protein